jgi:hypothetical protein
MVSFYWANLDIFLAYAGIIVLTCIAAAMVTLYVRLRVATNEKCLAYSYSMLSLLFVPPLLLWWLGRSAFEWAAVTSPLATVLTLPTITGSWPDAPPREGHWYTFIVHAAFSVALVVTLLVLILRKLRSAPNASETCVVE